MGQSTRYILLVDDDDGHRESLAEFLEDVGYKVVSVSNGLEALEHLKAEPAPSLILLDLMMPVMDGWEFREAQLRDSALASIPVLVITAFDSSKPSPVDPEYTIKKPIKTERLLQSIERFSRR